MKLRASSLELAGIEFATAVGRGEFDRAEGWLRVAMHLAERDVDLERPASALRAEGRLDR